MNGYNYDALNNTLTISASFAKKASRVNTPEYAIILKLRRDFPNLSIKQEPKRDGKKSITFTQMETFIALHRNKDELTKLFNNVRKLSRVQPMPYKYVKTWFENRFPYYSEQPTFDADGYVIEPMTLNSMKDMIKEVVAGNKAQILPAEGKVA